MPVIDVHVPQPTHTWKDFWIHLGTIATGLLIAISLEQSVEWVHRLHERHQVEADLRAEGLMNKAMAERDFRYLDLNMRYQLDLKDYLDDMRVRHVRLPEPAKVAQEAAAVTNPKGRPTFIMSHAAWTTAREGQLVSLLPRDEAETYARLYREEEEVLRQKFEDFLAAREALGDFSSRFFDRGTQTVDYSRMTDDELKECSELVSAYFNRTRSQKRFLKYFYGANDAVLNGAGSAGELVQAQFNAEAEVKDDLGSNPELPKGK